MSRQTEEILRLLRLPFRPYRIQMRARQFARLLVPGNTVNRADYALGEFIVNASGGSGSVPDITRLQLLPDGTIKVWGRHNGLEKERLILMPVLTDEFITELNVTHGRLDSPLYYSPEQRRQHELDRLGHIFTERVLSATSARAIDPYGNFELTYPDGSTAVLKFRSSDLADGHLSLNGEVLF